MLWQPFRWTWLGGLWPKSVDQCLQRNITNNKRRGSDLPALLLCLHSPPLPWQAGASPQPLRPSLHNVNHWCKLLPHFVSPLITLIYTTFKSSTSSRSWQYALYRKLFCKPPPLTKLRPPFLEKEWMDLWEIFISNLPNSFLLIRYTS